MRLLFVSFLLLAQTAMFGQSKKTKVLLHDIRDYGMYTEFAMKAVRSLEIALNSPQFQDTVLKMVIVHANGTNKELFEKIMQAHEISTLPGTDYVVDLRVRVLQLNGEDRYWKRRCNPNRRTSTVGVDGGDDGYCATCPQSLHSWYTENNVGALAGHYAHEYMHQLGFNHEKRPSSQAWRESTFVYQVGYIIRDLINKNKW